MASREAKRCRQARKVLEMQRFQKNAALNDPSFLQFLGNRLGVAAGEVADFVSENAIDFSRFLIEFLTRVPVLDAPQPIIPLPGFRNQFLQNDILRPAPVTRQPTTLSQANQARAGTKTRLQRAPISLGAPPVSQDPVAISRPVRASRPQTPGAPPVSQDPVAISRPVRASRPQTPGAPPVSQDPVKLVKPSLPDVNLSRQPTASTQNIVGQTRTRSGRFSPTVTITPVNRAGRQKITGRRVTRPQDSLLNLIQL